MTKGTVKTALCARGGEMCARRLNLAFGGFRDPRGEKRLNGNQTWPQRDKPSFYKHRLSLASLCIKTRCPRKTEAHTHRHTYTHTHARPGCFCLHRLVSVQVLQVKRVSPPPLAPLPPPSLCLFVSPCCPLTFLYRMACHQRTVLSCVFM